MKNYDLAVIGGGPGGYVAAIRASQLGLKVALIEKEQLGGICLNWGCIPTKSLLKSAELYQQMQKAELYGIKAKEVTFNLKDIVTRSQEISAQLVQGIASLLKKNKVDIITGQAEFINQQELLINGPDKKQERIKTADIIIATGARAKILPGFAPDGKNIWSYKEALRPTSLPKSMIIIGSGAIGVEFANFYNALGVKVTILEAANRILVAEDAEIAQIARQEFEKKGIKFITEIELVQQVVKGDIVQVEFSSAGKKQSIEAEKLLMAVGVVGNIEELGLKKINVSVKDNNIITNESMQTSIANIYAIGDVAGRPWLAHKASHEAIIAAEIVAAKNNKQEMKENIHFINKNNIPACTYSNPQIASLGLTEEKALAAGYELKIGRFPFYANAKAMIVNDKQGLIKTIFDQKTGELLGAHMVGSEVTELIQGYVIAKELESTEAELINTIFPHPTLSEMMHESVLEAFNRPIHI